MQKIKIMNKEIEKNKDLLRNFKELYFVQKIDISSNDGLVQKEEGIVYNLKRKIIYEIKGDACSCLGHTYRDKCKHLLMLNHDYKAKNGMSYGMLRKYYLDLMRKGLPPLPQVGLDNEVVVKVVMNKNIEYYVGLYERRIWQGKIKRVYNVVLYI